MAEIVRYILKMLPFMLAAIPVVLVFRLLRMRVLKARGLESSLLREACMWMFLLFLSGLLSLTLFSEIGKVGQETGSINLIPFTIIADTYEEVFKYKNIAYLIISFLGNIVMFIPLGFFPPLLWRGKPFKKALITAFSVSLFIEIFQIPLGRGTDVDDLILNTLGGVLGYLVFALVRKLSPAFTERFKIKEQKNLTA